MFDHQPVASEPCCDGSGGERSLPYKKLHDLKALHAHESENFGGLYERYIGTLRIRIAEKSGSPVLPLGVAGNIDSQYSHGLFLFQVCVGTLIAPTLRVTNEVADTSRLQYDEAVPRSAKSAERTSSAVITAVPSRR